jgi:pimeloyl-ACP methyl ester carboxylesterase
MTSTVMRVVIMGPDHCRPRIGAVAPGYPSPYLGLCVLDNYGRHMPYAHNGDCDVWFESFGDPNDPTLLLINGLGSQCINYPVAWCELFVAEGLHVVRFDNRDVGLSTKFDTAPVDASGAAYGVLDMAADAISVLDQLGVSRAHVLGLSMGGMIAQVLAIHYSDRLASMTSVMSHSGEPGIGQGSDEAVRLLTSPAATDRASFIAASIAGLRCWGSPAFADEDRWTADAERAFDRCFHPSGPGRQFLAIRSAEPRADALRSVTVPTLVFHGDCDTLIDQSGGRRVAELIPGARFELIEGMGHDYPPQLWPRWVRLIADHVAAHP